MRCPKCYSDNAYETGYRVVKKGNHITLSSAGIAGTCLSKREAGNGREA